MNDILKHLLWTAVGCAVIFRIGFARELVTGIKSANVDPKNPTAQRMLYI